MKSTSHQILGSLANSDTGFLALLRKESKSNAYLLCDVAYVMTTAVFLSIWHSRATHRFSFRAFSIFLALCCLSLIYGRFFIKRTSLSFKVAHNLSLELFCGYLVLSIVLCLLFFTPIGIEMSVAVVTGVGLVLLVACRRTATGIRKPADHLPDFFCLVLSGVAATLWCTDALRPTVREGPLTIYQTFSDSFFHSRMISSVAQAHGLRTMSAMQMSGQVPPMYQYATYVTPAAVFSLTNSTAYITFVSFLVPFGILLSGLAAFSLVASAWGRWPGIAATLAVTLLPDAYQQGFGNKWLSYYFFQQAAPGGLYGVACVALAWMFILNGCKVAHFGSILVGYALLITSILYKAQFFVANAFLLMIYPCFFFRGLRMHSRIISAVVLSALFYVIVTLSQNMDSVPTLRLDGSALKTYTLEVLWHSDPGFFKSLYEHLLVQKESAPVFCVYAAMMFLLSTFGIWTAICLFIFFPPKVKIEAAALLFPFLITINYLVISLGLAQDTKGFQVSELLHRPFVWAYFVVAGWSGAGVYVLLFGNESPLNKITRVLAAIITLSSFSVPLVWAQNLQTLPYRGYNSYRALNPVPSDLIEACLYIRKHSQPKDVIQDSENDPKFWVTGLAERQDFAADYKLWSKIRNPPGLRGRLDQLAAFKTMKNEQDILEVAREFGISWYLLQPQSQVDWPASVLQKPAFRAGNYRVYHFTLKASIGEEGPA